VSTTKGLGAKGVMEDDRMRERIEVCTHDMAYEVAHDWPGEWSALHTATVEMLAIKDCLTWLAEDVSLRWTQ
jgi:hypothetical protein